MIASELGIKLPIKFLIKKANLIIYRRKQCRLLSYKKVIASLVKKSSNYRILNTQLEEPSLTYPLLCRKCHLSPFQCQSTFHCSIILFGSVSLISESQVFFHFYKGTKYKSVFHKKDGAFMAGNKGRNKGFFGKTVANAIPPAG